MKISRSKKPIQVQKNLLENIDEINTRLNDALVELDKCKEQFLTYG